MINDNVSYQGQAVEKKKRTKFKELGTTFDKSLHGNKHVFYTIHTVLKGLVTSLEGLR